jgi:hypothetical protein
VKIGFSDNVPARIKQLEATYNQPLALLATRPGRFKEEKEIHARFDHLRFPRTEQFRPAPELMAFIGRPLLVGINPDAVEVMPATLATITIKGDPAWRKWAEELAEHCRMSVSGAVDYGLAQLAKEQGFKKKPPAR